MNESSLVVRKRRPVRAFVGPNLHTFARYSLKMIENHSAYPCENADSGNEDQELFCFHFEELKSYKTRIFWRYAIVCFGFEAASPEMMKLLGYPLQRAT